MPIAKTDWVHGCHNRSFGVRSEAGIAERCPRPRMLERCRTGGGTLKKSENLSYGKITPLQSQGTAALNLLKG